MSYETIRRWSIRACFLLTPLAMLIVGVWFALRPGRGYDIWTWAVIGALIGLEYGGLTAIALRLTVFIADNWRSPEWVLVAGTLILIIMAIVVLSWPAA